MEWDIVNEMFDEYYWTDYYISGGGKWDDYAEFSAYPQCGPISSA